MNFFDHHTIALLCLAAGVFIERMNEAQMEFPIDTCNTALSVRGHLCLSIIKHTVIRTKTGALCLGSRKAKAAREKIGQMAQPDFVMGHKS